jgi:hypothetical protein
MVDHVEQQFSNDRLLALLGQGGYAKVSLGQRAGRVAAGRGGGTGSLCEMSGMRKRGIMQGERHALAVRLR